MSLPLTVGHGLAWDTWHRVKVSIDQQHDTYLSLVVDDQRQNLVGFQPPRSFDGEKWLRGQLIEVLEAGITPDDVGGVTTNDDIYFDNLKLTVRRGGHPDLEAEAAPGQIRSQGKLATTWGSLKRQ